ncbi:hypothetical protein X730_24035 [Mesorhizobium sp. L103C565B0]|nr:hypothetical protein X730_24035 [Mesorhizobium sp. L103C565B0]ESZ76441.1 hypothetical protein X726_11745 [Mesorhizobium sp. L103C105A0]
MTQAMEVVLGDFERIAFGIEPCGVEPEYAGTDEHRRPDARKDVVMVERRSFVGGEHQAIGTVRNGQALLLQGVDCHGRQRHVALAAEVFGSPKSPHASTRPFTVRTPRFRSAAFHLRHAVRRRASR